MSIEITKKQLNALQELVATARAAAVGNAFPKEAVAEIIDAADTVEDLMFNADVDYTDWGFIDNLGQALIDFDSDERGAA